MSKRTLKNNVTVRYGDVSVEVDAGIATVKVGDGKLDMLAEQALRLADALAGVTQWGDDE
jgi:hypothetical protein